MKTYLKDLKPDEVIKRLRAGEVVKSNTYEDFEYKLVDGFIMSHNPDGYFLNPGIFISGEDLYFETPDELELEVGKCYRTRKGKKAFITYKEKNLCNGAIFGSLDFFTWSENGKSVYSTDENDLDLVEEWSDNDVAEK